MDTVKARCRGCGHEQDMPNATVRTYHCFGCRKTAKLPTSGLSPLSPGYVLADIVDSSGAVVDSWDEREGSPAFEWEKRVRIQEAQARRQEDEPSFQEITARARRAAEEEKSRKLQGVVVGLSFAGVASFLVLVAQDAAGTGAVIGAMFLGAAAWLDSSF